MPRRAILVIDMLEDFISGDLRCSRAERIVAPLERLLAAARSRGIPVVYANDAHLAGIDGELRLWGVHAMAGSDGARVTPSLAPQEGDYVLEKRRYSAFFQTGLHLLLRELNVDTLVLTGVQAHICLCHTAADAFYWNYHLEVPEDGAEAFDEDCYRLAFRWLKDMYGVGKTDVDAVIASMDRESAAKTAK